MSKAVNLAQVIRDNPGCFAEIDNDQWMLYKSDPSECPGDFVSEDAWMEANVLADCDNTFVPRLGDGGYGSGNCYGGDILQALAEIVGIKVVSV